MSDEASRPAAREWRWPWRMGLVFAAYWCGAELARGLSFGAGVHLTLWPPVGLLLAALLLAPRRDWAGYLAAAVAANLLFAWLHGRPFAVALALALINPGQSAVAAGLIRRYVAECPGLRRLPEALGFAALSLLASAAVGGLLGGVVFHVAFGVPYLLVWATYASSSLAGFLLAAPPLLTIAAGRGRLRLPAGQRLGEWLAWPLLAAGAGLAVILSLDDSFIFLALPMLLWATLRLGVVGATWSASLLSVVVACAVSHGHGAWLTSDLPVWQRGVGVQLFTVVATTTVLLLAAALDERAALGAEHRLITENMRDGVWTGDLELGTLWVSPSFSQRLGWPAATLRGRPVDDFLCVESAREFRRRYAAAMARPDVEPGELLQMELEFVDRQGTRSWGEVVLTLVAPDDRSPARLIAVARDITARHEAEIALRESEERFRTIVEVLPDAVIIADADARVVDVNRAACEQLGYSRDELLRMGVLELVPPEDRARALAYQERFGSSLALADAVHLHRDGHRIPIELTLNPLTSQGRPRVIAVARDVTHRKLREQALRDNERRLSMAVAATTDAVWEWAVGTGELYASPRWFEMLGHADQAFPVSEQTWRELCHPDDLEPGAARLREFVASQPGERLQSEVRLRHRDGSYRWILTRGQVTERDAAGRPLVVTGTNSDVTEQKLAEQALRQMVGRLEASNAELERFTYTVSHDLKSPLITVLGFVERCRIDLERERTDRLGPSLERVSKAADRMMQLLGELLELSRIGRLTNPPQAVPLAALVAEAAELVAGRLAQGGIELVVAAELPVLFGDRPRLLQVMQNLLDNGCKFMGQQPHPRLDVGTIGLDPDTARPILEVRDNGQGFDPAQAERIFGLFDQLDPSLGGTGIGLALVKRIVETHGGRIWAVSPGLGQGAAFRFVLPGVENEVG